jgi:ABC-type cobalamin transport system permease subunit
MMSQAGGFDTNTLLLRLRRLAMLDTTVFDEVRTDTTATIPAIVVMAASILLFGLGGWLFYLTQDYHPNSGEFFVKSVIVGSIIAIIVWGVWVAITYVMLTQIFRAPVDVNELVRVMGFAMLPLAIGVFMFIPALDFAVAIVAVALMFGASLIAVESASNAGAGKALAAVGAGFAVWALVMELLVSGSNTYAPGIFIFAPR